MLDTVTVTGTENLMMAATLADGETVLENAAREPEVVDLANFLIAMGAKIQGAGTDRIVIEGVRAPARRARTQCCRIASRPARSWWPAPSRGGHVLAQATRSPTTSMPCSPKLQEAGADDRAAARTGSSSTCTAAGRSRWTCAPRRIRRFPPTCRRSSPRWTAVADGVGTIIETIFENRFMHMLEMRRMGAEIRLEGNTAIIKGVPKLNAAPVMATDLRASASLVIAGLVARRAHR